MPPRSAAALMLVQFRCAAAVSRHKESDASVLSASATESAEH